MLKDSTVTARIDRGLGERLERLAAATGRSKSWVVNEALRAYLDAEAAFLEAVEEGRTAVREGRTVPQAEVERWLSSWGTDREGPPPRIR